MIETFDTFLQNQLYVFLLTFARIGAAIMTLPGTGDIFVPTRVRLYFALGLSLVMVPFTRTYLPEIPESTLSLALLIIMEVLIGIFAGLVARTAIAALDIAGMIISMQSGLANSRLFNPVSGTQGSLIGGFLSTTAIVLLFILDLHHMLLTGVGQSYQIMPPAEFPPLGDMANLMARILQSSFLVGVQIALPFMIISGMIHISMGLIARLMPQLNVLILSLPLQIMIGLITMTFAFGAIMFFWAERFEDMFMYFLNSGDP